MSDIFAWSFIEGDATDEGGGRRDVELHQEKGERGERGRKRKG